MTAADRKEWRVTIARFLNPSRRASVWEGNRCVCEDISEADAATIVADHNARLQVPDQTSGEAEEGGGAKSSQDEFLAISMRSSQNASETSAYSSAPERMELGGDGAGQEPVAYQIRGFDGEWCEPVECDSAAIAAARDAGCEIRPLYATPIFAAPREQRQRVSDESLRYAVDYGYSDNQTLDLIDARATIAQRDAEIARLCSKLAEEQRCRNVADEGMAILDQALLAAREALATAEAARIIDKSVLLPRGEHWYVTQESYDKIIESVDAHCMFLNLLVERLSVPPELPSLPAVVDWIASALATARRDAIDEAAGVIQRKLQDRRFGDLGKNEFGKGRDQGFEDAEAIVRALAPPAVAEERDDD